MFSALYEGIFEKWRRLNVHTLQNGNKSFKNMALMQMNEKHTILLRMTHKSVIEPKVGNFLFRHRFRWNKLQNEENVISETMKHVAI